YGRRGIRPNSTSSWRSVEIDLALTQVNLKIEFFFHSGRPKGRPLCLRSRPEREGLFNHNQRCYGAKGPLARPTLAKFGWDSVDAGGRDIRISRDIRLLA